MCARANRALSCRGPDYACIHRHSSLPPAMNQTLPVMGNTNDSIPIIICASARRLVHVISSMIIIYYKLAGVSLSGCLSHSPDTPLPQRLGLTMAVLWWIVACGVLMSASAGQATRRKTGKLSTFTCVDCFLCSMITTR